jgi:hypothetical protein
MVRHQAAITFRNHNSDSCSDDVATSRRGWQVGRSQYLILFTNWSRATTQSFGLCNAQADLRDKRQL